MTILIPPAAGEPYGRVLLSGGGDDEVLAMSWGADVTCAPHDHGASGGTIHLIKGKLTERRYTFDGHALTLTHTQTATAPAVLQIGPGTIHDMHSHGESLSVHHYAPSIHQMRVYDVDARATLVVTDDCGAWTSDAEKVVRREPWI